MFLKNKFNASGFSLLEVMVVMLAVMIITVNIIKLSKDQSIISYRRQANDDMNNVRNEIGSILADSNKCTAFLGGYTLNTTDTTFPVLNKLSNPSPLVPTLINIDNQFFAPASKFTEIGYNTIGENLKIGNAKIAIHSFQLASWSKEADTTSTRPSSAILIINFFRKTSRPWNANTSTWQGKTVNLALWVNSTNNQITKCIALDYLNSNFPSATGDSAKNLANGIKVCPYGTTMIGGIGERGTFCIDTNRSALTGYQSAISTCLGPTKLDTTYKNGSAHLCTIQEWTKACYLRNNMTLLTPPGPLPLANGAAWEWVSTTPVTNTSLASASNVVAMGQQIGSFDPCVTAKFVDPVQIDSTIQSTFDSAKTANDDALATLNSALNNYNSNLHDYYLACKVCQDAFFSTAPGTCTNETATNDFDRTAPCDNTACKASAKCRGSGSGTITTQGSDRLAKYNIVYYNSWGPVDIYTTFYGDNPAIIYPFSSPVGASRSNLFTLALSGIIGELDAGNPTTGGSYGKYLALQHSYDEHGTAATYDSANAALQAALPQANYRCCYR